MRILQLGKFYPIRGGVEKVMYELTTGLSARGIDCDMLTAAEEGPAFTTALNPHARLMGCHTWAKVCATMISPGMITALRKVCRRYDIIHVHHPDPMASLALMLSGYKGKVVVHWHSDIQKQRWLLRFYRPLQEWILRRADMVIGTSPVYLAESPHLTRVQHKTAVLPIGVDPILPTEPAIAAVRACYGHRKIVFSLGRLVAYKGYDHLVRAAAHLPADYVVVIGGSGPLRPYLESEIERLGLTDRVYLLGRVPDDDLPAYYGASTLFCLSSVQKTEAFGIVQIEAMSCGKPVVATTIPGSGVSWVNAHGDSGLNVPPGDARALAEAIVSISTDTDTYAAYADRARRRYESIFRKEQMISKTLELYQQLWQDRK